MRDHEELISKITEGRAFGSRSYSSKQNIVSSGEDDKENEEYDVMHIEEQVNEEQLQVREEHVRLDDEHVAKEQGQDEGVQRLLRYLVVLRAELESSAPNSILSRMETCEEARKSLYISVLIDLLTLVHGGIPSFTSFPGADTDSVVRPIESCVPCLDSPSFPQSTAANRTPTFQKLDLYLRKIASIQVDRVNHLAWSCSAPSLPYRSSASGSGLQMAGTLSSRAEALEMERLYAELRQASASSWALQTPNFVSASPSKPPALSFNLDYRGSMLAPEMELLLDEYKHEWWESWGTIVDAPPDIAPDLPSTSEVIDMMFRP